MTHEVLQQTRHEKSLHEQPGSDGEHLLQDMYGTTERAARFYREQVLDTLTPRMTDYIAKQTLMIVSSADVDGRPDASVRFGEAGFVRVIDQRTVCWPELRGNGVMTTLGNIAKNAAVHLMFLDGGERIGLHIRGEARIVEVEQMADEHPAVTAAPMPGRPPERWVVVTLENSYVHCRKHFPRTDAPVDWGTDDVRAKGGDYFGAKDTPSPWAPQTPTQTQAVPQASPQAAAHAAGARPAPAMRVKTGARWLTAPGTRHAAAHR